MLGRGLDSLIPPKDPNASGQVSVPQPGAGNGHAAAHPHHAGHVPHVRKDDIPVRSIHEAATNPEPIVVMPSHREVVEFKEDLPRVSKNHIPVESVEQAAGFPHAIGVEPTPEDIGHFRADIPYAQRHEIPVESVDVAVEHRHVIGVEPTEEEIEKYRQEHYPHVAYRPLGEEQFETGQGRRMTHSKRTAVGDAIFHIEIDKIKPNPFQPRKHFDEAALRDLANSIREFGILQPLVVSKVETETERGTKVEYQLIAGERRLMASKRVGLERVPVIIRQATEKAEQLELAIIENLQRENLDTIETARSYARLQDEFGLTQREIAARLGKSREVIGNALRLLALPVEMQEALSRNQINESQARLLLSIPNATVQKQLFDDLLTKNFSVRELKAKIKAIHNPPAGATPSPAFSSTYHNEDIEVQSMQNKLKASLGTEVKIDKKGDSGRIVINFYSPEELHGIVQRIDPGGE